MEIQGVKSLLAKLEKRIAEAAKDASPSVAVGFNAQYAIYVHENMAMKLAGQPRPSGKGTYWSPAGSGPKFLENPARELRNDGTLQTIILRALNAGNSLSQAMVLAGLRLQREAQQRVPVEFGNLKGSAFTELE